jgi:hypothetical protein
MKWYYEWKLKKIRAEISALEEETRVRLLDDFTAHSRLRVLHRLADGLQQKLNRYPGQLMQKETGEAHS